MSKNKIYKCKDNDVVIKMENDSDEILIGFDGLPGEWTVVGIVDLKYAMLKFGVDLNCRG